MGTRRKGVAMGELLYAEESSKIIDACFAVYRNKGFGFLEAVYQECLEIELADRGVSAVPQMPVILTYKGHELKQRYFPDLVCDNKILLEVKAVKNIVPEHEAQVLNYLRATGLRVGLIANFGHYPDFQIKRLVV